MVKKSLCIFILLIITGLTACNEKPAVNPKGNTNEVIWAIEPRYNSTYAFHGGVASISTGFIAKDGSIAFDTEFKEVERVFGTLSSFSYGIASVRFADTEEAVAFTRSGLRIDGEAQGEIGTSTGFFQSGKYLTPATDAETELGGYLNKQFLWYILPEHSFVEGFSGGYSLMYASGNDLLLVNEIGEVVNTDYSIKEFSEGLSAAYGPEGFCYIDVNQTVVINKPFSDGRPFSEGLAGIQTGGLWGFIDTAGNIVIEPQFEEVGEFLEGLAAVHNGSKIGFINTMGELVIPYGPFAEVGCFNNGFCNAWTSTGRAGLIDTTGEWVVPPEYDSIRDENGYYVLINNDLYGFWIPEDDVTVKPKYAYFIKINDAIGIVLDNQNLNYLFDATEGRIISESFYSLKTSTENLMPAQENRGDLWGFIDYSGQWVIQPQFEDAWSFYEGLAPVMLEGKWGYIANPLIYDEWSADENMRGMQLGLFGAEASDSPATVGDMLPMITNLIKGITGETFAANELWEALSLTRFDFDSGSELTRERASVLLAEAADYCGENIYCLLAFLKDENDIDENLLHHVSYAASFGLFDLDEAGVFSPKAKVSEKEMQRAVLRLFEVCL